MSDLSFSDAKVPVRADICSAHRSAWQRLAAPGTWWTGAERVAIAAEVRAAGDCALCAERRAALSPEHVAETHAASKVLPAIAVDAVHRITTDASRLSRARLGEFLASGLGEGHYVELVGVVVTVVSVDSFCRGIGVSRHPLPVPLDGEPSRYRPPGARLWDGWLPMVPESEARGAEADLYGTPRTGNVIKALSLVPEEVRGLNELSAAHYLPVADIIRMGQGGSALSRPQIELVAARVSAMNECFY